MEEKKRVINRRFYLKHKKKIKEQSKKYYLKNRKEILEKHKKKVLTVKHKTQRRLWFLKNKETIMQKKKEYRHRMGISKNYGCSWPRMSCLTEEEKQKRITRRIINKKAHTAIYRKHFSQGGVLTKETIALLYKSNIEKHGVLTCEYCKNNIRFGEDSIDHKIPLSKNGKNNYENLAIACRKCNYSKHDKPLWYFLFKKTQEEDNEIPLTGKDLS